jgi:peptide/nickel transport system permease protein
LSYLLGDDASSLSSAQRARALRDLGLDRPLLEQYGRYLTGIVQGDLGRSLRQGRPVTDMLRERLPWTLALVLPSLLLSTLLGTVLGVLAAARRGSRRDLSLLSGMLALDSTPGFWIGMVLIAVFAVQLGWLPSFGAMPLLRTADNWAMAGEIVRRLILPVATITLATAGGAFLVARASLLTTLGEDYVWMAEAKGVSQRAVFFRHALRNALLPIYTNLALSLGLLASGAVVVETVFSYPGLGRMTYDAVLTRDYPLLQGAFLLVAVGVLVANLLTDLTYPLLDPRVRRASAGT